MAAPLASTQVSNYLLVPSIPICIAQNLKEVFVEPTFVYLASERTVFAICTTFGMHIAYGHSISSGLFMRNFTAGVMAGVI